MVCSWYVQVEEVHCLRKLVQFVLVTNMKLSWFSNSTRWSRFISPMISPEQNVQLLQKGAVNSDDGRSSERSHVFQISLCHTTAKPKFGIQEYYSNIYEIHLIWYCLM